MSILLSVSAFPSDDLASVDGGQVLVKVLPSSVENEVALLGTARVRATSEFSLRMKHFRAERGR